MIVGDSDEVDKDGNQDMPSNNDTPIPDEAPQLQAPGIPDKDVNAYFESEPNITEPFVVLHSDFGTRNPSNVSCGMHMFIQSIGPIVYIDVCYWFFSWRHMRITMVK